MTLKLLFNAVVSAIRAGTGTHLGATATRVYKWDLPSWSAQKAVFVIVDTGNENPVAIGDCFDDEYNIWVDVRMPIRDETQTVAEEDWYDDFLELCEEVKVELTTVANRAIVATDSSTGNKMAVTGWEYGTAQIGDKQYHGCRFTLRYYVPQA